MARKTLVCDEKLHNFDYSSLLIVIKCQLKNMLPALENGHCIHSTKLFRRIRICINLCDRIINKDYLERYVLTSFEWEDIGERDEKGRRFFRLKGDNLSVHQRNWNRHISKQSDYRREYDKKMLFDLLSKYLFRMWD